MDYQFLLSEHGFMHTDYFQGTTGIQLNVYPLKHHTKREVLEMLKEDIDLYYTSIHYMFERNGVDAPEDIDEKLELLYSELESQTDMDSQFSKYAPTVEDLENEDEGEYPPYIFSLNVEIFE